MSSIIRVLETGNGFSTEEGTAVAITASYRARHLDGQFPKEDGSVADMVAEDIRNAGIKANGYILHETPVAGADEVRIAFMPIIYSERTGEQRHSEF